MATDAEIQKFVQRHHGFIPKTGWIAHVKEVHGVPTRAWRVHRDRDLEPCPSEKRAAIEEALRNSLGSFPTRPCHRHRPTISIAARARRPARPSQRSAQCTSAMMASI